MKSEKEISYDGLPDELLWEILCKLPARSICRFRCVCKSWHDLFQDQKFINRTRAKWPFEFEIQKSGLLKYFTVDERGYILAEGDFHFIGGSKYRRCNNLICYQTHSTTFYVLNLSTSERYLLPPPPSDSSKVCFNFEFGLDPCSKECKVLVWTDDTKNPEFYILTLLEKGRRCFPWRKPLGLQKSNFYSSFEKSFTTTTGMIYFFDGAVLTSSNLATEEFRSILLPVLVFQLRTMARKKTGLSDSWYSLFEYEGCFCWVELAVKYPIEFPGHMYYEITGMWIFKVNVDGKNCVWVRLMKETCLPLPMYASAASTTWAQKHSQFSSTRTGEIMVTISTWKCVSGPYILLYSLLDRKFRTYKIFAPYEALANETCRELV